MNALGPIAVDAKKDGNMRTAISAEATRKMPTGAKLPVISKSNEERECIESALYENAFMRNLSKDQFSQVFKSTTVEACSFCNSINFEPRMSN